MSDTTIVGLSKPVHSAETGTDPSRHVLIRYGVDYEHQASAATFGCYMSAGAARYVDIINVQLQGVIESRQAVYAAVLKMTDGPLAGATPIYAEVSQ